MQVQVGVWISGLACIKIHLVMIWLKLFSRFDWFWKKYIKEISDSGPGAQVLGLLPLCAAIIEHLQPIF